MHLLFVPPGEHLGDAVYYRLRSGTIMRGTATYLPNANYQREATILKRSISTRWRQVDRASASVSYRSGPRLLELDKGHVAFQIEYSVRTRHPAMELGDSAGCTIIIIEPVAPTEREAAKAALRRVMD